jgi:hypothetical protein
VPWRFSDAGRRSAWLASWVPASENLRRFGLMHRSKQPPLFDHQTGD